MPGRLLCGSLCCWIVLTDYLGAWCTCWFAVKPGTDLTFDAGVHSALIYIVYGAEVAGGTACGTAAHDQHIAYQLLFTMMFLLYCLWL
jgi:hypothetical protein